MDSIHTLVKAAPSYSDPHYILIKRIRGRKGFTISYTGAEPREVDIQELMEVCEAATEPIFADTDAANAVVSRAFMSNSSLIHRLGR